MTSGKKASAKKEARDAAPRLAALDVGSNTVHITVARIIKRLTEIERLADEADLVRLGADVSAMGSISAARIEWASSTIRRQVALARANGASAVLAVATQALRSAANGGELIERVRRETGVTIALVSGAQEAALTYWGATSGLKPIKGRRAVIDMGGGSLELALGSGPALDWRVSLPLGSGAISRRHMLSDPPTAAEELAVERVVRETLFAQAPPLPVAQAIVCGGTASALAALAGRIVDAPDRRRDDLPLRARYLTRAQLDAVLRLLAGLPAREVSRRYALDEGRARLLPAGGSILLGVMDLLDVGTLRVRRRGVREGAMLTYARQGERWLEAAADGALAASAG
jgi:exopolyphosphatase / guanosine-5'-triphosphate,3'-diphosphate pyrophosphatase